MRWPTCRVRNNQPPVDLLSIDSLSDAEIADILDRAELYFTGNRGRRSNERLHGRIVFNLF
jgi:aspartate carbamoyltransferase catalytic subunit